MNKRRRFKAKRRRLAGKVFMREMMPLITPVLEGLIAQHRVERAESIAAEFRDLRSAFLQMQMDAGGVQ